MLPRQKLSDLGTTTLPGDITSPEPWVRALPRIDAMIHAACDFGTAMGEIDRRLLDVLLPALAAQPQKPRSIYTGGCWLFGATGNEVATEERHSARRELSWAPKHLDPEREISLLS
jgi:hypothetical protein